MKKQDIGFIFDNFKGRSMGGNKSGLIALSVNFTLILSFAIPKNNGS